jgi:hypothetical protein
MNIGRFNLQSNDLDFRYLRTVAQAATPEFAELLAVVDVSRFFSRGAHHIVMALDTSGEAGGNNPHCGPIVRNGQNLFTHARGAILLGDGSVLVETWNGTSSPVLEPIANQVAGGLDPAAHRILTLRVRCHYTGGTSVRVRKGIGGAVLFSGAVASAPWAWTGQMRACLGGIALGFVAPQDTGCVEQIAPRSAPDARLPYMAHARVA